MKDLNQSFQPSDDILQSLCGATSFLYPLSKLLKRILFFQLLGYHLFLQLSLSSSTYYSLTDVFFKNTFFFKCEKNHIYFGKYRKRGGDKKISIQPFTENRREQLGLFSCHSVHVYKHIAVDWILNVPKSSRVRQRSQVQRWKDRIMRAVTSSMDKSGV